MKRRRAILVALVAAWVVHGSTASAQARLARIKQRGTLVCGISPGIAGFSQADGKGRPYGLDVDMCRAVSAAIFGVADQVRYETAASVEQFQRNPDIDLVSRRLTWSLQREGMALLFGPVMFYDGQGFLVPPESAVQKISQLSGARICVAPGGLHEANLTAYFRSHQLTLRKVLIQAGQLEADLAARRCDAFTADVSELGSMRSRVAGISTFRLLPGQISNEPLAQLVRAVDVDLFNVLRWTIFALIEAEEFGVTSANVDRMTKETNPDIRRLLGITPGNGKALGLDEKWAYTVIKTVGNYGEIYERNVGMGSPIQLPRGLNALSSRGGLMFAPPLR